MRHRLVSEMNFWLTLSAGGTWTRRWIRLLIEECTNRRPSRHGCIEENKVNYWGVISFGLFFKSDRQPFQVTTKNLFLEIFIPLRQLKVAILKGRFLLLIPRNWPIFRRIGHFLENRPFLSTLCTLKIRGIGNNSKESATTKLPLLAV